MQHLLIASLILTSTQHRVHVDSGGSLAYGDPKLLPQIASQLESLAPNISTFVSSEQLHVAPGGWGSTRLDMQEAGFRLLNGAARWVFRRLAWPEELPPYSFDRFINYVISFVDLWNMTRLTPDCDPQMGDLKNLMKEVKKSLCNANPECADEGTSGKPNPHFGIVTLPKLTTDEGFVDLVRRQLIFLPSVKDEGTLECETLHRTHPALAQRFCAPSSTRNTVGWRFWFDEWFPKLLNFLSCGYESDKEDKVIWEWVAGTAPAHVQPGGKPEWHSDVHAFIHNSDIQSKKREGDEEIVKKAWRLTYRYLTYPVKYRWERLGQFHQKELARFTPFLGVYLDRRDLNCISGDQDLRREELTPGCNAQFYFLFNFMATERQPFYGPHAWLFFHTIAERSSQAYLFRPGEDVTQGKGKLKVVGWELECVQRFKTFLVHFSLLHPCPHCRQHLLTKVQSADASSYQAGKTLRQHAHRNFDDATQMFQTSDEWLMYPLEWMTWSAGIIPLSTCPQHHVWGSCLKGGDFDWSYFISTGPNSAKSDGLVEKLIDVIGGGYLRIVLWKMHNAVDSTIESKHEERVAPWPASYWPISMRYRDTEPWDATDNSWAFFPVTVGRDCELQTKMESPAAGAFGSTIYDVDLRIEDKGSATVEDLFHLGVLQKDGPQWRALWMGYHHLVILLQTPNKPSSPITCSEKLRSAAKKGDVGFKEVLRQAINVENEEPDRICGGNAGVMTVTTVAQADAVAHWMGNWTLWNRLLQDLEAKMECVTRKVVDSGLLQAKYSYQD